ncbi:MAG: hypothetical protein ACUVRX_01300 [Actinomycetota bacterium]
MEEAARKAGFDIRMAFTPGRVDAKQEQVEAEFYQELEPIADGFRNYFRDSGRIDEGDIHTTPEYLLVDKAQLLRLRVLEKVILVGGLRVLGGTYRYQRHGVLTERPRVLPNDFFEPIGHEI